MNTTVIILRRPRPELPRPFTVRWGVGGVPVLPVLGVASVAVMMTQLEPLAIGFGVALSVMGLAAGWLGRFARGWRS